MLKTIIVLSVLYAAIFYINIKKEGIELIEKRDKDDI